MLIQAAPPEKENTGERNRIGDKSTNVGTLLKLATDFFFFYCDGSSGRAIFLLFLIFIFNTVQ